MIDRNLDWAIDSLESAVGSNFYGSVTFILQNGKILFCKQEETLKPPC